MAPPGSCQNKRELGEHVVRNPRDNREGRGRSAKKREAQAIEALAVRLIETNEALCRRLSLPDELREGLDQARRITARVARKREIKHLSSLLRRDEESVAAIRAALDADGRSNRAERDLFHRIEEHRDALCDPDRFTEALSDAAAELPGLDRGTITRLAKRVHKTGDKRASREIFRRLRALAEPSSQS